MDVLHTHCAGLDVHTRRPTLAVSQGHGQKTVVAARAGVV